MKKVSVLVFFISTLIMFQSCRVKLEPVVILTFKEQVEKLFPNAVITKMDRYDDFTRVYKLEIEQLLNFKNKKGETFTQVVYLSHINEELPMVVVAEAKSLNLSTHELSKIFKGNQIQIEDRFYSVNVPETYKKRTLANEDYHAIITKLKRLYIGKWISTGSELGAEIALSHKYKYPWDTETTVVYNPNLNSIAPEAFEFLENKGKEIMYLYKEETKFIPILKAHVDAYKVTLNKTAASFYIKDLDTLERKAVYEKLQNWLGYSVTLFPLN